MLSELVSARSAKPELPRTAPKAPCPAWSIKSAFPTSSPVREPPYQICVWEAGTTAIFDGSAVGNESDMLDTLNWPREVIVS